MSAFRERPNKLTASWRPLRINMLVVIRICLLPKVAVTVIPRDSVFNALSRSSIHFSVQFDYASYRCF